MTQEELMEKLEMLQQQVEQLEQEVARCRDRDEIENLVAKYQNYYSAGQGERIVSELLARDREDVSHEFGPSGLYIGPDKVATFYQKDVLPGHLVINTMTTPLIQVAKDRESARGIWFCIGTETDAGELGPNPPRTLERRALLTSVTPDGKAYQAEWVWHKIAIDFIRQSEGWKIWHLHGYDVFRCPFQQDWVTFSEKRFDIDGLAIDLLTTPNVPMLENIPTYPTEFHWQYRKDAVPVLEPQPPEPYEHWDGQAI